MAIIKTKIGDWTFTSSLNSRIWRWTNKKGRNLDVYKIWVKKGRRYFTIWKVKVGVINKSFPTDERSLDFAYKLMRRK